MLGLQFEVAPTHVEELNDGEPAEVVLENARRKARAAATQGALVIGCDTDVALDGRLLGKPRRREAGARVPGTASPGGSMRSSAASCLPGPEQVRSALPSPAQPLTFARSREAERERYVASGEWRGRAGGYAVQGLGATLIAAVHGDISNVIGLPIGALLDLAPELAPGSAQ